MDSNKVINSSLKLLVKTSIVVFIATFFSKIVTYLYRIIVARYYGPEIYGVFALSLMVFGIFSLASSFGFGQGLLRYIPFFRGKNDEKRISFLIKKSRNFLLISGILAAIILFFLSDFIAINIFSNQKLSIFLKVFAFMLPISSLSLIFYTLIRSYEKIGIFSIITKIIDSGLKLILLIIFLFLGMNFLSIPLSYFFGFFIAVFIAYIFSRITFKKIFSMEKFKDKKSFWNLFSYSWPLLFFGFVVSMTHWTDSFLIGIFESVESVGFYNSAITLAILITFSTELFIQLFFPLVTKEYSKGNLKVVKELSKQVGKWIYMISLPILFLFIFFPGVFIKIFFGNEYLIAVNVLRFLSISYIFIALFEISKQLLAMAGKSKLILIDVLIISSINFVLNLILIPLFGINGAAIATMFSFIVLGLIYAFQARHYVSITPLKKEMFFITIAAFISTIILIGIRFFFESTFFILILSSILFISLYGVLLYFFKCLDKNDLEIISLFKNKFKIKKNPSS